MFVRKEGGGKKKKKRRRARERERKWRVVFGSSFAEG